MLSVYIYSERRRRLCGGPELKDSSFLHSLTNAN